MTKDELIKVAVTMGLFPTKTAARAVPVAELRAKVSEREQAKEDEANARDEAMFQQQAEPCPYECSTFVDRDSKCDGCREDEPLQSDPHGDAYAPRPYCASCGESKPLADSDDCDDCVEASRRHNDEATGSYVSPEDAHEADRLAAEDRWLAEVSQRQADNVRADIEAETQRAERRVPSALRQRLEALREMPIRNRHERRRHAALQRDAVRRLRRVGLSDADIRAVR